MTSLRATGLVACLLVGGCARGNDVPQWRADCAPLVRPAPLSLEAAREALRLAETAPYLHDGRAPTVHEAIVLHGGEARNARDAYLALDEPARASVRVFLASLSREPKPFVP